MATGSKSRLVELILSLKDQITGQVGKVTAGLRKVDSKVDETASKWERSGKRSSGAFEGLISGATKLKLGLLAGVAAIAGLISKIGDWTAAAAQQERAETKLETTLRNLTGASDAQVQALKNQASALQELTGYGDEQIISAQAMLGTFKLTADQIGALTPGLLDAAEAQRRMGAESVDLEQIAVALGKAFTDGVGALKRYGVSLTETQEAEFKQASSAEKVRILQEVLKDNFEGLAEAVGNTYDGALRKAEAAQGDFQETLGQLLTQNESVVGLVNGWGDGWKSLGQTIKDNSEGIKAAIGVVIGTFQAAGNVIKVVWNAATATIEAGVLVINTALASVLNGLAAITPGKLSESFTAAAQTLEATSAEMKSQLKTDAADIGNAVTGIVTAYDNVGASSKKSAAATKELGAATDAAAQAAQGATESYEDQAAKLAELIASRDALKASIQAEGESAAAAKQHVRELAEVNEQLAARAKDVVTATDQKIKAIQADLQVSQARGELARTELQLDLDRARARGDLAEAARLGARMAELEVKQIEASAEAKQQEAVLLTQKAKDLEVAAKATGDYTLEEQAQVQVAVAAAEMATTEAKRLEVLAKIKRELVNVTQQHQRHQKDANDTTRESTEVSDEAADSAGKAMDAVGSLAAAMAAHMSALRHEVAALSGDALASFDAAIEAAGDKLSRSFDTLANAVGRASAGQDEWSARIQETQHNIDTLRDALGKGYTEVGNWFIQTSLLAERTKLAFYEQSQAAENLTKRLDEGNASAISWANGVDDVSGAFDLLDKQTLNQLQSAIDETKRKTEALAEAARSAKERYQDLIDQERGTEGELAIERRKAAEEQVDLEEQLAEARRTGNQQAVADLQQATTLAQRYHNDRINELNQELQAERQITDEQRQQNAESAKRAAQTPSTAPQPAQQQPVTPQQPSAIVQFQLPDGGKASGSFEPTEADKLLALLSKAGAASGVRIQ